MLQTCGQGVGNSKVTEPLPPEYLESYEHRVVSFTDVLGWRSHIEETMKNPERTPYLRVLVESWSHHLKMNVPSTETNDLRATSFSDNLVLSQGPEDPGVLLARLAMMQVLAAAGGFWIRGGITAGLLIHRPNCVFGPALNRAYELESKIADVPRILIGPELILQEKGDFGNYGRVLIRLEGSHAFIDPFTPFHFKLLRESPLNTQTSTFFGTEACAEKISEYLRKELNGNLVEKDRRRIIWLYNRLADNFKGDAFATFFPPL